jgi:Uma2 family endonuclease
MQWKELVESPHLQDLPYKIETNEWGHIVMTPTRAKRGYYQMLIGHLLMSMVKDLGEVVAECTICTGKGTKVADIAWFSLQRWQQVEDEYDVSIAPEICVEVLSPGNTGGEIKSKRTLYFDAGALEVWVCDARGNLRFYNRSGEIKHSKLAPEFPKSIS